MLRSGLRAAADRVVVATAISWIGLWIHELHRVPQLLGLTPDGSLPMLVVACLLAGWWVHARSTGSALALFIYAAVNLVGGGLSALPLGWLPFTPEPTLAHYTAHALYAACQSPLLVLVRVVRAVRVVTARGRAPAAR